jgi:hypothetical protein
MFIAMIGTACTSQPKVNEVDYSAWSVETLEDNLRTLQTQEVSAVNQKATTQADFEKLQEEFRLASDQNKPDKAVLLSEAAADYLAAQEEHMAVKRELRQARRAYIRKLLLAKQPAGADEGTARVVGAEGEGATVGVWRLITPQDEPPAR